MVRTLLAVTAIAGLIALPHHASTAATADAQMQPSLPVVQTVQYYAPYWHRHYYHNPYWHRRHWRESYWRHRRLQRERYAEYRRWRHYRYGY